MENDEFKVWLKGVYLNREDKKAIDQRNLDLRLQEKSKLSSLAQQESYLLEQVQQEESIKENLINELEKLKIIFDDNQIFKKQFLNNIQRLPSKIESSQDKMIEAEIKISELNFQSEKNNNLLIEKNRILKEIKSEVYDHKDQISILSSEILLLEKQLKDIASKALQEEKTSRLNQRLLRIKAEAVDCRYSLKKLNAKYKAEEAELQHTVVKQKEIDANLASLTRNIDSYDQHINFLSQKFREEKLKLDKANQDIVRDKAKIADTENQIMKVSFDIKRFLDDLAATRLKIKNHEYTESVSIDGFDENYFVVKTKSGQVYYGQIEHVAGFLKINRNAKEVRLPVGDVEGISNIEMVNYLVFDKKIVPRFYFSLVFVFIFLLALFSALFHYFE